jgi:hypothetical protein
LPADRSGESLWGRDLPEGLTLTRSSRSVRASYVVAGLRMSCVVVEWSFHDAVMFTVMLEVKVPDVVPVKRAPK